MRCLICTGQHHGQTNPGIYLTQGDHDFRCDCENVYVDTLSRKPDYHNYKAVVPASPTAEGRTIGFFLTLTTESGELTEPYYIKQD